jgi:mono/diheme cytochrome c family protein
MEDSQGQGRSTLKIKLAIFAFIVLAALSPVGSANLRAQSKSAAALPNSGKLNEQEKRGEGLFVQRCSLCHLPRNLKFGSPPVVGPILAGQFKDVGPDQMKILRGFILKGGPDMPGFQYGLDPKEVDDLIAYLKTL